MSNNKSSSGEMARKLHKPSQGKQVIIMLDDMTTRAGSEVLLVTGDLNGHIGED